MKEKELKIKQKSNTIKIRVKENNNIKEKTANLFQNRLKADFIKVAAQKKERSEKAVNEASVQAEEQIENTVIHAGLYTADTVMSKIIKSKKDSFQKYESKLTYADRNNPKNFDNDEVKGILGGRQEVLDNTKAVDKTNPKEIKASEDSLKGKTVNTAKDKSLKNKTELPKLLQNNVLKTKLIEKKISEDNKIQAVEKKEKDILTENIFEDYQSDNVKIEFPKSSYKDINLQSNAIKEPNNQKVYSKLPLNHRTANKEVKRFKLRKARREIQKISNEDNKINNIIPKLHSNHSNTDINQKNLNHRNKTHLISNHDTKTKQHELLSYRNRRMKIFLKSNDRTVKNQKLQKAAFQNNQIKKKIRLNTKKAAIKTTSSVINIGKRGVVAITKTAAAVVKGVVMLLGGVGGGIVLFVMIAAVLAFMTTAFGVFYSPLDNSEGVKKISEIVAETNNEFHNKVEDMKKNTDYDSISYQLLPSGENSLFITNWTQVVAVFAVKTAGNTEQSLDVVTIDDKREELLKEVFWDMNVLSYDTEKVVSDEAEKTILHIRLESKSYTEMIDIYHFTPYQKQAIEELMKPEYAQMLSELVGTIGVTGEDITLTPEQIQEMLKNLPEDLSPKRQAVMEAAYSLVGKVNYFWGGKSSAMGWDSRWGTPTKVTAAGSIDTGTTRPFGLDCSGFVTWAFINATGDSSYAGVIGHGAANQYSRCKKIDWSEAQAGNLVFYPDLGHVGIIAGKEENGNLLVVHCASSQNNVVVTGLQGFTKIGRPALFDE